MGTFTAALVGGVALASAGPASAYTMDAAGQGFVGKGEVQSAFGWNNAKMQANQNGVTFTVKQNASQALSSSASQTATQEGSQSASQTGTKVYSQTATQDVTETLSCFKNGAAVQNVRHGVRSDFPLPEHLEDVRQAIGINAHARVLDNHVSAILPGGDRHGDRHSYRQP